MGHNFVGRHRVAGRGTFFILGLPSSFIFSGDQNHISPLLYEETVLKVLLLVQNSLTIGTQFCWKTKNKKSISYIICCEFIIYFYLFIYFFLFSFRTKENTTSAYPTSSTMNALDSAHGLFLGYDHENILAKMIGSHLHVQRPILTRCVLDLVKYFANSQSYGQFKDEFIIEWLGYFFLRHRNARFEIPNLTTTTTNQQQQQFDDEEKNYVEFVFLKHGQNEQADNIRNSLLKYIGETKLANGGKSDYVGMLWWYYFLKKYDSVKYFFINNLAYPETILDGTLLFGEDRRPIKTALTNMILNRRTKTHDSHIQHQKAVAVSTSHVSKQNLNPPPPIRTHPTEHRTNRIPDVIEHRANRITDGNEHRANRIPDGNEHRANRIPDGNEHRVNRAPDELSSNDDFQEHYQDSIESTNISSTVMSRKNLKETLALEGLKAVERKLTEEELQYFQFRYSNQHLEDAYEVWKNLKVACNQDTK